MPRVLRSALWHNQGMGTFAENLRDMTLPPRSIRAVARLTGVDDKTIRNWLDKQDPSGNIKAKQFILAVGLPWPAALGDFELTPAWWATFHARFEDNPAQRAISYIKTTDWSRMTPAQQAAIVATVAAFEVPGQTAVAAPARRRRTANPAARQRRATAS